MIFIQKNCEENAFSFDTNCIQVIKLVSGGLGVGGLQHVASGHYTGQGQEGWGVA